MFSPLPSNLRRIGHSGVKSHGSKTNPNYHRPRRRRSTSRDVRIGTEVEKNYPRSESRLICASTGTAGSLILQRCFHDVEDDRDDEFFTYTETTGSLLLGKPKQLEKSKGDGKKKPKQSSKKSDSFPFRRSLFAQVPPYVFFHSHDCTCSTFPKLLAGHLRWKLNSWTPPIVRRIVEASGFRVVIDDLESWSGTWEHTLLPRNCNSLKFCQKVNHFPGTSILGRKDQLCKGLKEMTKRFGKKHFTFTPSTYVLPKDKRKLMNVWNDNGSTKWIVKPPNSGCGVGVHVVHQWWEIPVNSYLIVQRYLASPKLIAGAKFDLRLYVLVTSFDPLRVYLYSDGLVRIATTKYDPDTRHNRNKFMHLTNTSVNKHCKSYRPSPNVDSATGHLWSLKSLWSLLEKESVDIPKLWETMKDIVVKTLITAEGMVAPVVQSTLTSRYSCFELFGFDVLIEEDLRPWLLEVNTTPSLQTDSPVHRAIKGPLVRELFNVVGWQLDPNIPDTVLCELAKRYRLRSVAQNFRLHDKTLTHQATRKHFNYAYRNTRAEYLTDILLDLTPDDVRNLVTYEDEITQLELFERIFPTRETYKYLRFFSSPRYYDMLFDAWENEYGHCRSQGIRRLQTLCKAEYHLMA